MQRTDLAPVLSATSTEILSGSFQYSQLAPEDNSPKELLKGLQISQSVLGPSSAPQTICSTSRWAETSRKETRSPRLLQKHFHGRVKPVFGRYMQILWRQGQEGVQLRVGASSSRRMRATTWAPAPGPCGHPGTAGASGAPAHPPPCGHIQTGRKPAPWLQSAAAQMFVRLALPAPSAASLP